MDARLGFEPRLSRSERAFLPLEDRALAGVVGFEPTVHGVKFRCLTTWLHPKK